MTQFFIDFDSTIISGEILDILANISLTNHPNKSEICKKITDITTLGMTGQLSFSESLSSRIALLQANHDHILLCIDRVKPLISKSFGDFCDRTKKQGHTISIVSGGFREIIGATLGNIIDTNDIYANDFLFDDHYSIVGADLNNPLAHSQGKVKVIQSLQKSGYHKIMIGDGFTDYETRLHHSVDEFYYYAEHVQRSSVMKHADKIIYSFNEI